MDSSNSYFLEVDASDGGVGAVQYYPSETTTKSYHTPSVSFLAKRKIEHQCSTIEKETQSLQLALHHFEHYVQDQLHVVIMYSDHNP